MLRTFTLSVALALSVVFNCGIAFAAEAQTWSVKIVDDTAILRAAPKTDIKFVHATLDELQKVGIKKLTLSSDAPATTLKDAKF